MAVTAHPGTQTHGKSFVGVITDAMQLQVVSSHTLEFYVNYGEARLSQRRRYGQTVQAGEQSPVQFAKPAVPGINLGASQREGPGPRLSRWKIAGLVCVFAGQSGCRSPSGRTLPLQVDMDHGRFDQRRQAVITHHHAVVQGRHTIWLTPGEIGRALPSLPG